MPVRAEPAEAEEAQRLLGSLNRLIVNVGETYVELSGHTAAAQAVVADLRRCSSFLQSRLVGEPQPAPWLTSSSSSRGAYSSTSSPAATPPDRRASLSQDNAQAPGSVAPAGFVPKAWSPSPERASPFTASGGGISSVAGKSLIDPSSPSPSCTPVDSVPAPATGTSTATRPPLPGGSSGTGGRAGSVGRAAPCNRTPVAGPRSHANVTAAERPSGLAGVSRTRDTSPQRRTGVRTALGTFAAVPAPPRPTLPTVGETSQVRELAQAGMSKPGSAGSSSAKSDQAQGDASATDSVFISSTTSHLPLAAQRALAAAAALGVGFNGSAPQGLQSDSQFYQQQQGANAEPKPAGLPQLPLPLRRAMHRYRETLKTRDQLLQQYQEKRRGGGSRTSGGTSLADTVTAAGNAYRSTLARQFPHSPAGNRSNISGGGGGGVAVTSQAADQLNRMSLGASPAELQRRAQVLFAALVAAQTWLIQSLSELARTRGTHGGVAGANRRTTQADTCVALLADLELLRIELGDLQAQLRAAVQPDVTTPTLATSRPPPRGAAATVGLSGCVVNGSSSSSRGIDALAGIAAELEIDDEELEEAAALRRNRFLRSLLCDISGSESASSRGRRGPAAPGFLQKLSQPAKQLQQPARDGLAVAAGEQKFCMRRPVGLWLPDAVWAHVPIPAGGEASAATAGAAGAGYTAPDLQANSLGNSTAIPETPWHVLLPSPPPMVANLAPAGTVHCMMAPPALLCSSVQDAVAHGRAQLQLQATAFQLLLEGSLAAPLLPRQRPPPPPVRVQMTADSRWQQQLHHHSHHRYNEAAALAWERWLAQCRLAHLLLLKGARNRFCSIAELELEGETGDEIGEQPPPQQWQQ
ncbi:hypothetical protein VaNZ11_014735 [Volvox africanus]|uniref:DUF4456 domain-containing protein n=1 Tax=Volvox africanus TaxID=51714 RepID=A0ABQ5SK47_9CHLO|nr:hypothetical protein VaNZ11_014735 [Volvox africanus]